MYPARSGVYENKYVICLIHAIIIIRHKYCRDVNFSDYKITTGISHEAPRCAVVLQDALQRTAGRSLKPQGARMEPAGWLRYRLRGRTRSRPRRQPP